MRQTYIAAFLITSIFSFVHLPSATAAPSGGPYGPVAQTYAVPENAHVIYVSPDGDRSVDGSSIDHPTILKHAVESSTTGAVIILRGGVYRTGSIRFNQGITLQPYEGEEPILKGTEIASNWKQVSDSQWQTEWNKLFPAEPADWWRPQWHLDTTPIHRFNYDMVFIDGKRLKSAGGLEELTPDAYFIDYLNRTVTIGTNPQGRLVEITAHDSALVRTMRTINGVENDHLGPTIRGIRFTQYARLALLVEGLEPWKPMDPSEYGKDVIGTTLEHLEISFCSRVAGYFRGDGLTIRNCLISDCGTEGIYVINSSDVLLERNIVTRTNSHAPIEGYYASAVKIFNQSYRVVCKDNVIINNPHSSGIWYDVGNRESVVVDNWIENTNDGAFFEISEGARCAGNQFVNCNPGVRALNSADVAVYQNTFYNSALEVIRTLRSSEAGDHFGWHASAGPAVADRDRHLASNNLFLIDQPEYQGAVRVLEQTGVEDVAKQSQLKKLNGNVYVRTGAATNVALLMTGNPSYPPSDRELDYFRTLAGFSTIHQNYETEGSDWSGVGLHVVRSPLLHRFELLESFPSAHDGIELPEDLMEVLDTSYYDSIFPGAWKPVSVQ